VNKGLAARKTSADDRRQVALELTAKGRKAYEGAQRETQESLAAELAALDDDQRATVAEAMRLMSDVFLAADPVAARRA
jgi:DNA-binding MarR family transcriptional regulator